MFKSIPLILLFTLSFFSGFSQEERKKKDDGESFRDNPLILPFDDNLIEKDTLQLRILPDPWEQDTTLDKYNMPIVRPYSTDPMPNFNIAEPGVTYYMRNSMGPDHYTRPLSADTLKIDQYKSDKR
jgi:hypothetical protein